MMRVLSLFILSTLACVFTSCGPWQSFTSFLNPNFEEELDVDDTASSFEIINSAAATSVIQDFTVEIKHQFHLELEQAKTYYEGGLHAIQLQFITQDLIEMNDARELIVDMTENLLAKLNQDPILAKDIANYPFNAANLEIYITFESYFGRFVDPYYIRWICMEDGKIDYYTFDLNDNTKNNWHARHESYATSREIVVYQREAERKYDETYEHKPNIFGNQRYYPKPIEAPKSKYKG